MHRPYAQLLNFSNSLWVSWWLFDEREHNASLRSRWISYHRTAVQFRPCNSVCIEIRCQIIFIKHRFSKNHELQTFGTRKMILRKKKLEGCSCARKRSVVFRTFHTFTYIFFPRTIFSSSPRVVRYTVKCMESFMKIIWHRISIETLLF